MGREGLSDGVFKRRPAVVTAEQLCITLRCANPDCNTAIGQAHFYGSGGVFRVFNCPKCGQGSEFKNTAEGITAAQLATKPTK